MPAAATVQLSCSLLFLGLVGHPPKRVHDPITQAAHKSPASLHHSPREHRFNWVHLLRGLASPQARHAPWLDTTIRSLE
jgi:hypothetical protein